MRDLFSRIWPPRRIGEIKNLYSLFQYLEVKSGVHRPADGWQNMWTRLETNAKFPWKVVKNVNYFTNFQIFLWQKDRNIHLRDKFPLKIAKIFLQKQDFFLGMRLPNSTFCPCMHVKMMMMEWIIISSVTRAVRGRCIDHCLVNMRGKKQTCPIHHISWRASLHTCTFRVVTS